MKKLKKQISHFEKGLRDEPMDTVWSYFGSCPVNPAFSTRVNVNEHKTFHKLWVIECKSAEDVSSSSNPNPNDAFQTVNGTHQYE